MYTLDPNDIPAKKMYGMMVSAIGPRPIAFASTLDKNGNPNLAPFSFFNMVGSKPPTMIFSPVIRMLDDSSKHTLQNVLETKEVVINVVNHAIVQQTSFASSDFADGVNEFEKAGLTMLASEKVKPFRVKESPVQFECKVNDVVALGKKGGAGNIVICEVLKMHISESVLDEERKIDQYKLDQVARMGGNYYTRAKAGIFEIPKPLEHIGIGVDQMPTNIRQSKTLTGNDLGKLATVKDLPSKKEVDNFITQQNLSNLIANLSEEEIHQKAQDFLEKEEVVSAWKILLAKTV
ncbi:flavin reductase family protein [Mesonia sp. K7]|uniref:flavin reductase family protein n=1 Tax=Mesonia sp. K7 TaxID=2218606 RepID=UPI000DAA771A|nr:flavin reductase family protein [Mesonia sp. K7]PZD77759.1 flavin reductase family protein [Mesonia sp. K7]